MYADCKVFWTLSLILSVAFARAWYVAIGYKLFRSIRRKIPKKETFTWLNFLLEFVLFIMFVTFQSYSKKKKIIYLFFSTKFYFSFPKTKDLKGLTTVKNVDYYNKQSSTYCNEFYLNLVIASDILEWLLFLFVFILIILIRINRKRGDDNIEIEWIFIQNWLIK